MLILSGCGDLPQGLLNLISWCFKIIKIGVPIALVIWGMLDFAKASFANDDKQISAAKTNFLKRTIAAVAVFLVLVITQWVMNLISVNNSESIASCLSELMNGNITSTVKDNYNDNSNTNTTKRTNRKTTTSKNISMNLEGAGIFANYENTCGDLHYDVIDVEDDDPNREKKLQCIIDVAQNDRNMLSEYPATNQTEWYNYIENACTTTIPECFQNVSK